MGYSPALPIIDPLGIPFGTAAPLGQGVCADDAPLPQPLLSVLKPLYGELTGEAFPFDHLGITRTLPIDARIETTHCIYSRGLEGSDRHPDRLKIVMFTVNGNALDPEGVPYHAICSGHPIPSYNIFDNNCEWPVREIASAYTPRVGLNYSFTEATTWKPFHEAIRDLLSQARIIAVRAYEARCVPKDNMDVVPFQIELGHASYLYPHPAPMVANHSRNHKAFTPEEAFA